PARASEASPILPPGSADTAGRPGWTTWPTFSSRAVALPLARLQTSPAPAQGDWPAPPDPSPDRRMVAALRRPCRRRPHPPQPHRRSLNGREDADGIGDRPGARRGGVLRAFEREVGHLALDRARAAPVAPRREARRGDLAQQRGDKRGTSAASG